MKKQVFSLLISSVLLLPTINHADELETLVVTANRVPQTSGDTLASVLVISRKQIEQSQALSIVDLLQSRAGISFANNGGLGKNSSLFLRGTESDHVAVLIDGVKVGSATTGQAAFAQIPLSQVERIEVVRGPRSSLFGSEAIGGVIQLFTRKGKGAIKPNVSVGFGSDNTAKTTLGVSGGSDNAWFNAQVSRIATEGFNSCRGSNSAGCFTDEPDDDGYRNVSGQIRTGYRFDNETEVDLHWLRAEGNVDFDGLFQNQAETMMQVLGAGIKFAPHDIWDVSVKAGRSWDEADNFKDGSFSSQFNTQRDTLSLQNDIEVRDNDLLTLGLDYQNDEVVSSTAYPVSSRHNIGGFAQYLTGFGQHELQLSLRTDDNQQFGQHSTGNIAWGYQLSQPYRITAAYGTGFKAPTFNELYFPDYGNPNLTPEKSSSVEFGLQKNSRWGQWGINIFQTQIKDLIAYDSRLFAPNNIKRARIRGLELTSAFSINQWTMRGDVTFLNPLNLDDEKGDTILPRRAKQSLGLHLDRKIQQFNVGMSVIAMGKRYDNISNSRTLTSFARFDLRASYQFNTAWQLLVKINNVLDKQYETAAFYNQADRGYFLTLNYQP